MAFPTDTYLQFIRNGYNWVALEFENLYAQLQGYLSAEHKDNGEHSDVNADSLTTERIDLILDATDSTSRVLSFKNSDQTGLAVSSDGSALVISSESVSNARTPVFAVGTVDPGSGVSSGSGWYLYATNGDNWSSIIGQDAYADFLGFYNDTFGSDAAMKLYRSTGGMRLCPPTGTSGTHTLGSPDASSLRWDGLYIDQGTIFEGGSTTALGTWQSYTPSLVAVGGSPTIGSGGTLTGRYTRVSKTIAFAAELTLGTSFDFGTGNVGISLPVAASTSNRGAMAAFAVDTGTAGYAIVATRTTIGGNQVCGLYQFASLLAAITSTAPFTFVAGDVISVAGWFEEA